MDKRPIFNLLCFVSLFASVICMLGSVGKVPAPGWHHVDWFNYWVYLPDPSVAPPGPNDEPPYVYDVNWGAVAAGGLGLILPSLFVLKQYLDWTASKRIRVGHCSKCGYDLRATNEERCPNCGTMKPGYPLFISQTLENYLSSVRSFTDSKTVRTWLGSQSHEDQIGFGKQILELVKGGRELP